MTTNEHILSMPLSELRERVELAERMALAARLTPSGTYDAESAPVNTAEPASGTDAPAPRKRRTKAEIEAEKAEAAKAEAAATGPSDDELMASMASEPAGDAGGAELSLDDIGDDDMMAGFETAEISLSVADARKKAEAIVNDIITKKDAARLAVAREALVKVGSQKASEVPDDKIVEFYNLLPKS